MISHAARFAAEAHKSQKRKGEATEPYVNHLAEVAELVAEATNGGDPELIAAAWLHDAIEDQAVTRDDIAGAFGEGVAELVCEVTDDKRLPKQVRKDLQVTKTRDKTSRARLLKLADKTSNLRALANSPPADWPRERRQDYVRWARSVVDAGCRGLCGSLEKKFDEAALRAELACDDG